VLVIDSMGEQNATDAQMMPNMVAFNETALSGPQRSCAANFTLPCLLTAFEGRESPFLRALDNFSASASTHPNWLASLRSQGRRIAIVSDHTLLELYPQTYVAGENYESLKIHHKQRDTYAYERGLEWVKKREHDVLIIHVIGTDQASHQYRPGAAEYKAAFGAADHFVGQLTGLLDFRKDTLLVFGDHGHGDGGHHNRQAWYAMAGPGVKAQKFAIEQRSLLFLMSRAAQLPLPAGYEGSMHWATYEGGRAEKKWRQNQATAWGLTDPSREALEKELATRADARSKGPLNNALSFLPWCLNLLFILSALARFFLGRIELRRGFARGQLLWMTAAVIVGPWVAWLGLLIQLLVSKVTLRGGLGMPAMLVYAGLVLISGTAIPAIIEFFHIKSGVGWPIVYWFVGLMGVPLLLGVILRPVGDGTRIAQGALLILFVSTIVTTPGVYYYGWAQNLCRFLTPLALVAILLEVKPFNRRGLLLLAAFAVGLTTIRISAGGWDWAFRIVNVFQAMGPEAALILATGLLALNGFIWKQKYPKAAWATVGLLLAVGWLLAGPFEFEAERLPGFALTTLCASAGLRLLQSPEGEESPIRFAWQVALMSGLIVVATLIASDGFYLRSLRFEFALHWLAGVFDEEWALALVATIIVAFKYMLVFAPILVAARLTLGLERALALGKWVLLILCIKLSAQALQMTGVSFVEEEKMSELLLQEMVGFLFIGLCVWSICLKASIVYRIRQWAFGRDSVS
jgi:hypothetical protein